MPDRRRSRPGVWPRRPRGERTVADRRRAGAGPVTAGSRPSRTAASAQPAARRSPTWAVRDAGTCSTPGRGRPRRDGLLDARAWPPPAGPRCRRGGCPPPPAGAWARGGPRPPGPAAPAPGGRGSSASVRAAPVTTEDRLPPKAPPLASGVAGSPPGAPGGVQLQVGGLDPGRAQRRRPVARRHVQRGGRARRSSAGPAPCRRRPGLVQVSPPPTAAGVGTATSAPPGRRRRRSRRGPAPRPATRCWGEPPSIVARRGGGRRPASARRRRAAWRGPSQASRIVRQPVHRHRWARAPARPRPRRRPAGPGGQAGQPHDDPGRAEAALAGAGGAERLGPATAARRGRARRAWSPTGPGPAGPASRTPPAAARPPAPCSTRTGPGGCSRP